MAIYTIQIAARSFHIKKHCTRTYSITVAFYQKNTQKSLFEPPIVGPSGNVRILSMARWKSGWNVISENQSKSAFFELFWAQNFRQRRRRPLTTAGVRKLKWLTFRVVSKYLQCIVWFRHKARVWRTDGQTDRQNYDSQDRASVAARAITRKLINVLCGAL